MKRHIEGLNGHRPSTPEIIEGVFLARVDRVFYRWHPERPFYVLRLVVLEPSEHQGRSLTETAIPLKANHQTSDTGRPSFRKFLVRLASLSACLSPVPTVFE